MWFLESVVLLESLEDLRDQKKAGEMSRRAAGYLLKNSLEISSRGRGRAGDGGGGGVEERQ